MLAEELDLPITVVVAGETFTLGILDLEDYAQIQQEVRAEMVQRAIEALPNSHTAADLRAAEQGVPYLQIEGLTTELFSPTGPTRFLKAQLRKGGMTDESEIAKAEKFIRRKKGLRDAMYLAADASGLFPAKDEPDPNPPAGTAAPATLP